VLSPEHIEKIRKASLLREAARRLRRQFEQKPADQTKPAAEDRLIDTLTPQSVTEPNAQPHIAVIDRIRKLLRAHLSDDELLQCLWPTTRQEIEAALTAANITLPELRQQGHALGVAERKTALQRKAASGDTRAEEMLREDLGENVDEKACPYCRKAKPLDALSDEELRAARAKLQATIDYQKPIENLPATVHIRALPEKTEETKTEEQTNGQQTTSNTGQGTDAVINVLVGPTDESPGAKSPAIYQR